jgi:hypothetical protein
MTANQDANLHAEVSRAAIWSAMLQGLRPSGQRAMVAAKLETLRHGVNQHTAGDANLHVLTRADAAEMLLNAGNPARWTLIVNGLMGNGWPMPRLPVLGTLVHLCQDDPDDPDDDPLLDLTAAEIARLRGVSRQRGHQILAAARAAADMHGRVGCDEATHPSPCPQTPQGHPQAGVNKP